MISVIVSVYEQPVTLGWLLDSLARQDYQGRWEVLVTDDGSDPDTLAVVKDASRRYPVDVRYIWQPDMGYRLSRSRNNAVRCAQGDLLVFLDGDMVVRPDFLREHAARQDGTARILCGTREWMTIVDDPPRDIDEIYAQTSNFADACGRVTEFEQQQNWIESESPWMAIVGCNFSVPKAAEVVFNEQFCGWGSEDREFACRLTVNHGFEIRLSDAARGIHIGSTSRPGTLNPFPRNDARGIVELMRNILLFRRLHPSVDMTPTLWTLQHCSLDAETDTWSLGEVKPDAELDEIVESVERWMDARGISFRPAVGQDQG